MRKIRVQDSVGSVLCHDITRIVPGVVQEAAFKKGHVVRSEDIPELLKLGKEHLYVWQLSEGMLHEDDAAIRLAHASIREGITMTAPSEGKVEMTAAHPGVLKVDVDALREVNSVPEVTIVTRRHDSAIYQAGEQIAASRVIPLVIDEERVSRAEQICQDAGGILQVVPFLLTRAGVVVTGNEVYHGRIKDGFGPVLKEKFAGLGCEVVAIEYAPDDPEIIAEKIHLLKERGVHLIAATGGMSVDPDDRTPGAIKAAGATIVSYGLPMLPGNMFLVAYMDEIPVVGLPGCVMFKETTAFDLLVPRMLTGERLTRQQIVELGHGGLLAYC